MTPEHSDEFERIRVNLTRGLAPSRDDGIFLVRELEMLREVALAPTERRRDDK